MADVESKQHKQLTTLIELLKNYDKQEGKHLHEYSDDCFIQDVIYFLGLSFDKEKYKFHCGMEEFVKMVDKALTNYRK